MTKFLTDLTQRPTGNDRLSRLLLPRGESLLGLCNPGLVYGGKRLVLHLDHNRVIASMKASDAPFTPMEPENGY